MQITQNIHPIADINVLVQERRNSIANALSYVFLGLTHWYILWVLFLWVLYSTDITALPGLISCYILSWYNFDWLHM